MEQRGKNVGRRNSEVITCRLLKLFVPVQMEKTASVFEGSAEFHFFKREDAALYV